MHQFVVKIVQIQRSAKLNTMGCTERTAHCGHISLAEVVVLFSQQMLPFHNILKQSLSLNLNSLMLMQQLTIIGDTLNNDIIQATTVCGIEVD